MALAPFRSVRFALWCFLTPTACGGGFTGPTVSLNQQFSLAPGEMAALERSSVRLQFTTVTGDSRCPADAVCILGGDAVVQVRMSGEGAAATLDLHTGDTSRGSGAYGGVRVELFQLQPYPFSGRPIALSDYRATLRVTQ